jgi:hypothetical protein
LQVAEQVEEEATLVAEVEVLVDIDQEPVFQFQGQPFQ